MSISPRLRFQRGLLPSPASCIPQGGASFYGTAYSRSSFESGTNGSGAELHSRLRRHFPIDLPSGPRKMNSLTRDPLLIWADQCSGNVGNTGGHCMEWSECSNSHGNFRICRWKIYWKVSSRTGMKFSPAAIPAHRLFLPPFLLEREHPLRVVAGRGRSGPRGYVVVRWPGRRRERPAKSERAIVFHSLARNWSSLARCTNEGGRTADWRRCEEQQLR